MYRYLGVIPVNLTKPYRQLPILRRALEEHMRRQQKPRALEAIMQAAQPAMPASQNSAESGTTSMRRLSNELV